MAGKPGSGNPQPRRRVIPLSTMPGAVWPAMVSQHTARMFSLLYQLRDSQWWSLRELQTLQMMQLQTLLRHAFENVPLYRQRLGDTGWRPDQKLTPEVWRNLPILQRRDLQGDLLISQNIPAEHGKVQSTQTSGSTGEPVRLAGTDLTQLWWTVFVLREHEWHRRDVSARLACLRAPGESGVATVHQSWGLPVNQIYPSGPTGVMSLKTDISRQMEWLQEFKPQYLLSFPSNLQALIDYSAANGIRLEGLREVRTISETVTPRLRESCHQVWGVPLTDVYSSQEAGYIAIQCPDYPVLHVQSESVLVEIVDDEGEPCAPGETGRILVTPMHNFATPLIRYELRDRAEVGAACPCGRGLPVISRILGRERNMLRLPDGAQRWPLTGYQRYGEVTTAIRQFQFIQHSVQEIEVRLVVARPLTAGEEDSLRVIIIDALGHPFTIRFSYHEAIARSASGKFEEFISHVE